MAMNKGGVRVDIEYEDDPTRRNEAWEFNIETDMFVINWAKRQLIKVNKNNYLENYDKLRTKEEK
jgi:hypothetical protein